MTRLLAEPAPVLFRSASGRTELTDDPDGHRLHVTTGTDLWTVDDAQRLLLALADALHDAREPAADAYPNLFFGPAPPERCDHLKAGLATDATWYWSQATGVLHLCTPCWKAHMFPLTEAAAARYEAETLPLDGAA